MQHLGKMTEAEWRAVLVQDTLQHTDLAGPEREWLTFILTLMRWHRRFDIALGPMIMGGAFDVALDE